MRAPFLSKLELEVLLAVASLEPDAYGAPVRKEVENRASRPVAIGELYAALGRLRRKGFGSARDVSSAGRRPRRYCSLTAPGKAVLEHSGSLRGRVTQNFAYDSASGDRQ